MRSISLSRVVRVLAVGSLGLTSLAVAGANVVPKPHEKQAPAAEAKESVALGAVVQAELEQRRLTAMANTQFVFDESPFTRSAADQRAASAVTSASPDDNANWPRPGVWSGYLATVLLGFFFVLRRIR